MAPRGKKKAAAAPTPPLDGCSIALSGSVPGKTQAAIESQYIVPLGATLAKSVTDTTSHLVTNESDYNKPSVKVKSAKSHNVPIVTFQWLEDCLAQTSRAPEDDYSLDSSAVAPTSTATNGARKRSAAPAAVDKKDDEDNNTQTKKQRKGTVKTEEIEEKTKENKVAEGQVAKSSDVKIPVDEGVNRELAPTYEVYIGDDGVIYDASLNQTNATNNNNKFYRVQVLRNAAGDFRAWTRWGRVGEYGTSKALGDGTLAFAMKEFHSKFKGKSGLSWDDRNNPPKSGKYAFIEKSYEPDSDDDEDMEDVSSDPKNGGGEQPASKLSKPVQELMELIFNLQYFNATMADLNYDSAKLPLGKLSKSTITRGFQALKDLSELLNDPTLAASTYQTNLPQATEMLSNLFYTLIPHSFGRNRPPVINDHNKLNREIDLLDNLGDMKEAVSLMKADKDQDMKRINMLDSQFKSLGLDEMTALDHKSDEYNELQNYLMHTRGATHTADYKVSQIFRIERQGEKKRFDSSFGGPPRDRRLLFHGSRVTNFGGILSQGLRIAPPEAPVSGYMFGKGVYLADMSSKSANYCCSGISNGHALLLLCEVELGDPMQHLTGSSYSAGDDAKAKGMFSTWGQGQTAPPKWKDAGCVHPSLQGVKIPDTTVPPGATNIPNTYLLYNEFIAYNISQIRLRYLLRVKM